MGRHRGPRFSFPLPGRKSHSKADKADGNGSGSGSGMGNDLTTISSISSTPSVPDRHPRYDERPNISKAQRVLGTAPPPFHQSSSRYSPVTASPGYVSITVSEAESDFDDRASSIAMEDGSFLPPRRPNMSNRASSNIIPTSMAYSGGDGQDSNCSSVSRQIHPCTSNSTIRSHYDAKGSPLSISQQTSDSAIRDMALRKGKPRVGTYNQEPHPTSPLAYELSQENKKEHRQSKPTRLDLSKLFPKPKGYGGQGHSGGLLSPNKIVNSPTAMSTASDYFPRPMTREPTPTLNGHAKLTKPTKRQQTPLNQSSRPTSPVRSYKRDAYESAKVHVRRPPRGIKHWFDGLDEDSDEMEDAGSHVVHAPIPIKPSESHRAPARKSSLGRLINDPASSKTPASRTQPIPDPNRGQYLYANTSMAQRFTSPSQVSLQSQASLATNKTKDSSLAKTNLQNSSVLSFSSSEDEAEYHPPARRKDKAPVRDSIEDEHGEIVIGQAQALEVRPQSSRRPSVGKLSLLSNSTNAATIEVMYTPEPFSPQHFPRIFSSGNSRRSSHVRQPSVIHEDVTVRPKTSSFRPHSPSSQSVRTSTSEPRSRAEAQKFMAVTAEEEALLEALRKKRAAMAQQSFVEGYTTAIQHEEVRQNTPPEGKNKDPHWTSGFWSAESPMSSPVRLVETKKKPSRKPLGPIPTPLLVPPSRGRSTAAHNTNPSTSMFRDSSSCDPGSARLTSRPSRATLSRRLSPPPDFSPLDPFPSQSRTASVASPNTLDQLSPLPSPVTPVLRNGETDLDVQVAGSEPSLTDDTDEAAVFDTGFIDTPSGSIKPDDAHTAHHQRRRTASSGADVPIPFPLKSSARETRDLTPVSEASSRAASIVEPVVPLPILPRKSSLRQSSYSISTFGVPKTSHNSIASARTASPINHHERRPSRSIHRVGSAASIKRDSVVVGSASTRCSISEDVLAAWGSLGGLRDYNGAKY